MYSVEDLVILFYILFTFLICEHAVEFICEYIHDLRISLYLFTIGTKAPKTLFQVHCIGVLKFCII